MKKIALLAIAALSFTVISCKEGDKVEQTETEVVVDSIVLDSVATDSTTIETPEAPADSVENVVVEETVTAE